MRKNEASRLSDDRRRNKKKCIIFLMTAHDKKPEVRKKYCSVSPFSHSASSISVNPLLIVTSFYLFFTELINFSLKIVNEIRKGKRPALPDNNSTQISHGRRTRKNRMTRTHTLIYHCEFLSKPLARATTFHDNKNS